MSDIYNIDGREFLLVSSTASTVDPDAPTVFRYREDGLVVWGTYAGGVVERGHFVGRREADVLDVRFVHRGVDGEIVQGGARARIELDAQHRMRLIEDFAAADGSQHISICHERTVP